MAAVVADMCIPETRPKELVNGDDHPAIFDGATRLYICYSCPFSQRVWITRNYKGLQNQIQMVPISLKSKPAWYAEKVHSAGNVPSLEHNGKVFGESLHLIKYLEENFEGPSLSPEDPSKKEFSEELYAYIDTFSGTIYGSFGKPDVAALAGPGFDHLENALCKFNDGPFFLGQFSLVDIAFMPTIERFQLWLKEASDFDITAGRPNLAVWIEEVNKIEAYKQTKTDPNVLIAYYRMRFARK